VVAFEQKSYQAACWLTSFLNPSVFDAVAQPTPRQSSLQNYYYNCSQVPDN